MNELDSSALPRQVDGPGSQRAVALPSLDRAKCTGRSIVASRPAPPADRRVERYGELLGTSRVMSELFASLRHLEKSLTTVLIQGESGTGKELCARAIHDHSASRAGPFIGVNCGALDRTLARSELFGHERGAFTGAVNKHLGYFRQAAGGTLFLDEIAELPLEVQPVLLRALEARSVMPLGGRGEVGVQVRVIAATHTDLAQKVAAGQFRQDLFYRIHVVSVSMPPLRGRLLDVPLIAQELALALGGRTLPDSVVKRLLEYSWPGNVRELRNNIESYLVMESLPFGGRTRDADLDRCLAEFADASKPYSELKDQLVTRFLRAYLPELLRRAHGNQSRAAKLAGLDRSYLGRLLTKL